jgi:hypothetical protein
MRLAEQLSVPHAAFRGRDFGVLPGRVQMRRAELNCRGPGDLEPRRWATGGVTHRPTPFEGTRRIRGMGTLKFCSLPKQRSYF